MIIFKPIQAILPNPKFVKEVAALPYDVYSFEEAKKAVVNNPYSFLRLDRGEINFEETVDALDPKAYQKAKQLFQDWLKQDILIQSDQTCFYLYEITTNTHQQTGLVGLTAVSDLVNGKIKDHEKTRKDKLTDRINHIQALSAHSGPILMIAQDEVNFAVTLKQIKQQASIVFDFIGSDHHQHKVYQVTDFNDQQLILAFTNQLKSLTIADGHHRATAAKQVAVSQVNNQALDPKKPINTFLSVLFLHNDLNILEYNRIIKDLNGLEPTAFLELVQDNFEIIAQSNNPIKPTIKGEFGMLLDNDWFHLRFKHIDTLLDKPMELLDVSILQNFILDPILGIKNPTTDQRIDFVGGIRGVDGLVKRVKTDARVAFALVAPSMQELLTISELGFLMPPKSTWFEPKLLSGLFIHPF